MLNSFVEWVISVSLFIIQIRIKFYDTVGLHKSAMLYKVVSAYRFQFDDISRLHNFARQFHLTFRLS